MWYRRLGHPASHIVDTVLKQCNIAFSKNKVSNKNNSSVCVACQKGKAHKLSFAKSETIYTFPFELVIFDL